MVIPGGSFVWQFVRLFFSPDVMLIESLPMSSTEYSRLSLFSTKTNRFPYLQSEETTEGSVPAGELGFC